MHRPTDELTNQKKTCHSDLVYCVYRSS